jgi:two-component system NtrC family sensor kinase
MSIKEKSHDNSLPNQCTASESVEVPAAYLKKWQKTVDLMASVFEVPAGLIMRVFPTEIEVFLSSQTEGNPYEKSEKASLNTGLYCETVMAQRDQLQVPNALEDVKWKDNPDVKLNMISYLGVPLTWPNDDIFGTICVLDSKTRDYSSLYQALLWQFKEIIDGDLRLLISDRQLEQRAQELTQTLTHLKATQQELIQSEKMAALGHLVAGIAHEINTPLGAIRSSVGNIVDFLSQHLQQLPTFFQSLSKNHQQDFFVLLEKITAAKPALSSREKRQLKKTLIGQLQEQAIENPKPIVDRLINIGVYENIEALWPLLKDPESPTILNMANQLAIVQKSTQSITTASDRAAKTVFALKKFARFDTSGEKVQANIIEGIETVLTLYQSQLKQGVEVIKNYTDTETIWCYPDELNQVWTNLIHNALQAMDYKGTLTIDAKLQDNQAIISITDSGKGIPTEIKPKIFEPFFTTKPAGEGSGLGLDIVGKIIEKHTGVIEVESQPGKTTFTIFLPIT